MTKEDRSRLSLGYAFQFGTMSHKGCGNLARIIKRFVESDSSADTANYKQMIAEVAEERKIQPNSLKRSIQRFIDAGWKHGSADNWKHFIDWNQDTPPNADMAIRLLCGTVDNLKVV